MESEGCFFPALAPLTEESTAGNSTLAASEKAAATADGKPLPRSHIYKVHFSGSLSGCVTVNPKQSVGSSFGLADHPGCERFAGYAVIGL